MIDCTPASIIEASKCYCGLTAIQNSSVDIYLLCQWANNLTPSPVECGIVSDIIILGGGSSADGTYVKQSDVLWTQPSIPFSPQIQFDGINWNIVLFGITLYQADVFPCTWVSVSDPSGPPIGHYFTPGTYAVSWTPDSEPVTWTDSGGGHVGNLGLFHLLADGPTVTSMIFGGTGNLTSLTGINTLTSLATLSCNTNALTALDCTNCAALTTLDCSLNASLTTLTLTGCAALTTLNCSVSASLTSVVGLTSCTSLVTAQLNDCDLLSVDVHGLASLDFLDISNNVNLNALNVTGCTAMTNCMAGGCSILSAITGIGTLSSLSSINLNFDNFAAIDFTGMASLTTILMNSNLGLTSLTVTGLSLLINVDFGVCALVQSSVDSLLTRLDNAGLANGGCDVSGGTNSAPSSTAPGSPYDNLVNLKGWIVNVNP